MRNKNFLQAEEQRSPGGGFCLVSPNHAGMIRAMKCFFRCLVLLVLLDRAGAQPLADWSALADHLPVVTADTFSRLLNDVYAPDGSMLPYLQFSATGVSVYATATHTGAPLVTLTFATRDVVPVVPSDPREIHIALDPGHIGGAWSRMEERFFLVDRQRDWPVQEAAMNLYVARLIRDRLEAAGLRVTLVKDDFEPVTETRPDDLLTRAGPLPPPDPRFDHLPALFVESSRRDAQRKMIERQFYRNDEISARAERVNRDIRPDVTLCIHFNATGRGDEKTLHEENGLAFFIHGNYLRNELEHNDQKYFLLAKILERSHGHELGLTRSIAEAFVAATGLPPSYRARPGGVMQPMDDAHYIYARNLAANRRFAGPVIFLEPYFMNSRVGYARIQAGDYDGEREIEGGRYPSIFREYADAVTAGVLSYYGMTADSF